GYKLRIAVDEDDNDASFEVAKISYQLRDDVKVWGGEFKAPFLREELVGPGQQLAVERSLVNEVFTMGYVQGLGVEWMPMDNVRLRGSLNDGVRSGEIEDRHEADLHIGGEENDKQFDEDNTDFALTGRADVAIAGGWDQARDFTAWEGEPMSIVLGGGVHYEEGETGDNDGNNDFLAWTLDGTFEQQGWSAFGALHGLHTDFQDMADPHQDYYGFVAQGAYTIDDTYQPFLRYEYLDLDDTVDDNHVNLVTAGFNWYNNRHDAKFTADILWALDEVPTTGELGVDASSLDRLGLIPDEADEEDQVALRLQYQLMF
ncbi:MAG: porin, partial [Phycisphaeraceae bacterium]